MSRLNIVPICVFVCLASIANGLLYDKVDLGNEASKIRSEADDQIRAFQSTNQSVCDMFQNVIDQVDTIVQNLNSNEFMYFTNETGKLIFDELQNIRGVTGAMLDQYSDRAIKQKVLNDLTKEMIVLAEKNVKQFQYSNKMIMFQYNMVLLRLKSVENNLEQDSVGQIGTVKSSRTLNQIGMEIKSIDATLKKLIAKYDK